ncbi:hypothetical protein RF11_09226 [Thelohanellus kitauei]|uniref:Uncharacterized protein n=1 Tax=Thelohanellus kitauei TaxID=669202 RepID=A0A0C2NB96_THEKT|nr:hypothetical protein RF11_09226 [Thelohanellus kitauei]
MTCSSHENSLFGVQIPSKIPTNGIVYHYHWFIVSSYLHITSLGIVYYYGDFSNSLMLLALTISINHYSPSYGIECESQNSACKNFKKDGVSYFLSSSNDNFCKEALRTTFSIWIHKRLYQEGIDNIRISHIRTIHTSVIHNRSNDPIWLNQRFFQQLWAKSFFTRVSICMEANSNLLQTLQPLLPTSIKNQLYLFLKQYLPNRPTASDHTAETAQTQQKY